MSMKHHLDDATLMSCAAGSQPEALAAVVGSHLAVCHQCASALKGFERIGAAMFDDITPAPVARPVPVVTMRAAETEEDQQKIKSTELSGDVPRHLVALVGRHLDSIQWKRLASGIWHYPLPLSQGADGDLRLIKVAPGVALPEHGHGGSEMTMVLRGSYRDKVGEFRAGDVADLGDDIEHAPVADPVTGCICLVATDKPAKFKGLVARLLQPLTGM